MNKKSEREVKIRCYSIGAQVETLAAAIAEALGKYERAIDPPSDQPEKFLKSLKALAAKMMDTSAKYPEYFPSTRPPLRTVETQPQHVRGPADPTGGGRYRSH